jgi:hypothetical protein
MRQLIAPLRFQTALRVVARLVQRETEGPAFRFPLDASSNSGAAERRLRFGDSTGAQHLGELLENLLATRALARGVPHEFARIGVSGRRPSPREGQQEQQSRESDPSSRPRIVRHSPTRYSTCCAGRGTAPASRLAARAPHAALALATERGPPRLRRSTAPRLPPRSSLCSARPDGPTPGSPS